MLIFNTKQDILVQRHTVIAITSGINPLASIPKVSITLAMQDLPHPKFGRLCQALETYLSDIDSHFPLEFHCTHSYPMGFAEGFLRDLHSLLSSMNLARLYCTKLSGRYSVLLLRVYSCASLNPNHLFTAASEFGGGIPACKSLLDAFEGEFENALDYLRRENFEAIMQVIQLRRSVMNVV
ncbi:hypothetical protein K470DRAFT_91913 [Piedraia hortae CBS 480.64]|uniref:Uncharacterized protein n=1 Tax=Piedraia hortae CBS 480.64 TaxID=1314780 RepID=A0A6A7BZ84_9PEZI|nr:hypothetical protein K470DRAFT_91913 [Piedraia hortae CBS 480.64]